MTRRARQRQRRSSGCGAGTAPSRRRTSCSWDGRWSFQLSAESELMAALPMDLGGVGFESLAAHQPGAGFGYAASVLLSSAMLRARGIELDVNRLPEAAESVQRGVDDCGASEAHLIPDVGSRYSGYCCGSRAPGGAGPHDAALGHWSPHQELVPAAGGSGWILSGVERCTGGRERGGMWRRGGGGARVAVVLCELLVKCALYGLT